MAIKFYKSREKYGPFSNFTKIPVYLDDRMWPTTEHYYQSQKFLDKDLREQVRLAKWAGEASQIGRDRGLPLRDDWEVVKLDVMRKVVRAKIEQYDYIRDLLLSTGDEEIIEDSPIDYFWGCGKTGTGHNWLGKIWMEMREDLRQDDSKKSSKL